MDLSLWNNPINYASIVVALLVVSAYPLYRIWRARQEDQEERRNFAVHTAMDDLDTLGRRFSRTRLAGTAVIVGGR